MLLQREIKQAAKLARDIPGCFHQRRAIAKQLMTASRLRIVDRAGNRKYFAALFGCQARGDQ